MNNRILLFGAKGFIGRNLVDVANVDGLVVQSAYRMRDIHNVSAHDHHFNLLEDDSYSNARSIINDSKPDLVINAIASGVASSIDTNISTRVNVEWPSELARICEEEGVSSFIHFGSCAEYGTVSFEPAETTDLAPMTPYGVSKAAGTTALLNTNLKTLNMIVLRLYPVFGIYEQPNKIFPQIITGLFGNNSVNLGDKHKVRNYSYSKDVARHIFTLGSMSITQDMPTVINIGSDTTLSLGEWSDRFAQTQGNSINTHNLNWGFNASSPGDPDFMAPNLNLLKSLIGPSLGISRNAYADTFQYWVDMNND